MKVLRIIILSIIPLSFILSACDVQAKTPTRVELKLIADGFTSPVALIDPKDGSQRLFVVKQLYPFSLPINFSLFKVSGDQISILELQSSYA